jgi:hypothetical protein
LEMTEDLNLSCKSVQHRLATQWGYVKAEEVADEREACAAVADIALLGCERSIRDRVVRAIKARGEK